jgi:hypothetical protein
MNRLGREAVLPRINICWVQLSKKRLLRWAGLDKWGLTLPRHGRWI